jgi:hypothetical protein
VLLQFQSLNNAFFRLVYNLYDVFGAPRDLSAFGYEMF